jgi:soluble lytic murein transglycosylase-like protein
MSWMAIPYSFKTILTGMKHSILILSGLILLGTATAFSQVYSYTDQSGVRVLTNVPPTGQISDLEVSGAPILKEEAPKPAAKAQSAQTPAKPVSKTKTTNAASVLRASTASKTIEASTTPIDYGPIIQKAADTYNLDPKLIHSMIQTESAFNAKAVSPKGAQGLMQLMPATASRMGVRNPFDPEENIAGGAKYMRFLLDTFAYDEENRLILSLAAYNAGENIVQKLGRVPAYQETGQYVSSILARYGKKTMDEPIALPVRPVIPSTFSYVDAEGVLNLTNIPPILGTGTVHSNFR